MADNTRLNPGFGGDNIALDEISDSGVADGAKVQRIKPGFGTDGNFTDVSSSNPLPVTQASQNSEVTSAGRTKTWVTDMDGEDVLGMILDQLKITNIHLSALSGLDIDPEELDED